MSSGHLHTAAEPRSVNVADRTRRLVAIVISAVIGAVVGGIISVVVGGAIGVLASNIWRHGGAPLPDVFGVRGQQVQRGPYIMECQNPWWQDKLDCTPLQLPPDRGGR
jgi:hypothetical protein